jgi:hypothetical protein
MCFPPLRWQTYDIYFTAARWNKYGRKVSKACVTVFHNGVAVHFRRPLLDKTGSGEPEGPQPLPIYLQDHGDAVTFRNIWIAMDDQNHGQPRSPARRRGPLARLLFRHRR